MELDKYIEALQSQNIPLINQNSELLLKGADPKLLEQKIRAFKKLNIEEISDKELADKIENILMIDNVISLMNAYSIFSPRERFYRVRRFKDIKDVTDNLMKVSDYWNPPKSVISRYGRLNKPRESLLYTTMNPRTAFIETHTMPGDYFALFVYEATRSIQISWIGSGTNYNHHNISDIAAIRVHEILKQFLIEEFTKIVPDGKEYLYRTTEHVAKEYFQSPNQDGWRYPSIKDRSESNICFKTDDLFKMLRLTGAIAGKMCDGGIFGLEYVTTGFDEYGNRETFEEDNAAIAFKKMFPEFRSAEK